MISLLLVDVDFRGLAFDLAFDAFPQILMTLHVGGPACSAPLAWELLSRHALTPHLYSLPPKRLSFHTRTQLDAVIILTRIPKLRQL